MADHDPFVFRADTAHQFVLHVAHVAQAFRLVGGKAD
jgi:hypothetical protein